MSLTDPTEGRLLTFSREINVLMFLFYMVLRFSPCLRESTHLTFDIGIKSPI